VRERWCCVGRFLRERLCVVWCVCAGVSCCVLSVSEVRGQQELRALREAVVREAGVLGPGWARTKVNMAIFRHSAVDSVGDRQVAGWYDGAGRVCLGERRLGEDRWRVQVTELRGRVTDAHNVISLAFDGAGELHVSWDHHGHPLRYVRVSAGGGLEPGERQVMVGRDEERVTYPEFYRLPDGGLLFFYREGAAGAGNLVLNRYRPSVSGGAGVWERVQSNLIDGEGERNAYWQACVDGGGVIHLSWVWRETPDVVTNHDLCYARSADGGVTWTNSAGVRLLVPMTAAGSEYACRIAQGSELANQTSMSVDGSGRPVIATFWRGAEAGAVPQYRLVYLGESGWRVVQVGERTLNFERRGGGTKRPPISRPLLLLDSAAGSRRAVVLFRDQEWGGGVVAAVTGDYAGGDWEYWGLTGGVGQADPLVDFGVWRERGEVHLLSQLTGQGDGEREESVEPTAVRLLEWRVRWPDLQ
jgi:hypothetical protein